MVTLQNDSLSYLVNHMYSLSFFIFCFPLNLFLGMKQQSPSVNCVSVVFLIVFRIMNNGALLYMQAVLVSWFDTCDFFT